MTPKEFYNVPFLYDSLCGSRSGLTRNADQSRLPAAPLIVDVPGSKSITNRALLLATLADGVSTLRGALFSDDSRHFLKCIQDLGFETTVDEPARTVTIKGLGGRIPLSAADQYVGSAGTAARFLTAYLGLSDGVYRMDASEQMRKRPMAPLLDSLKELGCEVLYDENGAEGHFPFTLRGHGFQNHRICVNIDSSSQFLSALMIVSCLSEEPFTIYIEGTHGMAYINMTQKMMEQFGVTAAPLYYCSGNAANHSCTGCANSTRPMGYRTEAGQRYTPLDYRIEPDVSAACYFYAMSPLLNIPVRVNGIHFDSLQGDVEFIRILEQMGCSAADTPQGIVAQPPLDGHFRGVTADMSACSDQAITLAAIAPFADTPTTINGIGHIRFQESDRLSAISTELGKMGIACEKTENSLTIHPGCPKPATVETYDDHRMAMGFSLTGLRAKGIVISNPGCCRKTFEGYFDVLDSAAAALKQR